MEDQKNPFAGTDKFSLSSEEKRRMSEDLQSFMRKHPVAKKAMEADLELTEECRRFFALARRVSMTEGEQELVGEAVRSFVGMTPLRGESASEQEEEMATGILSWLNSGLLLRTGMTFAFSLAIVGTGGMVSYAAESALPGDFLYPVKISITESIQGRFLATEEERVRWEAHRASRRLTEAGQLASESRLDAETRAQLQESLARHLDDTKRGIERLAARDAVSAAALSSSFEVSLKAHMHVLSDIDPQAVNVEQLLSIARTAAAAAEAARTQAEQAASSSLDDGMVRAQAASAVRSARERIEVVRGEATARDASVAAHSLGILEAAASALTEATAALEDDPTRAYSMAKSAARLADEADALLVVRARIQIASSAPATPPPASSDSSVSAAVVSSSEQAGSSGTAFDAINAAESAIESARGYLSSVQDRVTPAVMAQAGEQLNAATSALAAARASLTVRAFADIEQQARSAEASAEAARRTVQEALRSAITERGENSSVSSPVASSASSSSGVLPQADLLP